MQPAKPDLRVVWDAYGGHLHERREQQVVCLVHDEARPSASVNLDEQVWNCHACGAGGDVYSLIRIKEGLEGASFKEVVAAAERITGGKYDQPRPAERGRGRGSRKGGFRPSFKRKGLFAD